MCLSDKILESLRPLVVVPRRLRLATHGVEATVPMLRGVWGAALHEIDRDAYTAVFSPPEGRVPQYILRPAQPDPDFAPAVEWISIGEATRYERSLVRAWIAAAQMGLGKQRTKFQILDVKSLRLDGAVQDQVVAWPLSEVSWPGPIGQACWLEFPAPLRLIRHDTVARRDRLILKPTLTDLIVAACRRLKAFLPIAVQPAWVEITEQAISVSREVPQREWCGQPLDLVRYSGRQRREVQINGVAGWLDLPEGPGQLWPLLGAARWLHLGKSTAVGLGQLVVRQAARVAPGVTA